MKFIFIYSLREIRDNDWIPAFERMAENCSPCHPELVSGSRLYDIRKVNFSEVPWFYIFSLLIYFTIPSDMPLVTSFRYLSLLSLLSSRELLMKETSTSMLGMLQLTST